MTNLAHSVPRTRGPLPTFIIGNALIFSPVIIGLIAAGFTLAIGGSLEFVIYQYMMFLLLIPLLYIMRTDDMFTSSILLVSSIKSFYLSQFLCVIYNHAPDLGLFQPGTTVLALADGLASGMLGILLARFIVTAMPLGKPILRMELTPERLLRLGSYAALVGLPSQAIWTVVISRLTTDDRGGLGQAQSGLVLFSYLAPLSNLALCCFAAERLIVTKGKSFLSLRFLIVLGIYFAAIAGLGTKTEPLTPVVAVFVVAILFKWKPSPGPIIAGLAILVFVATFLFPVLNLARLRAFAEQRPVPIVLAEVVSDAVSDPAEFEKVLAFSANYQRDNGLTYYGHSVGFFDRFTPVVTDRLIVGAQYALPEGAKALSDAALSILPQTLGFKRDRIGEQLRVEAAMTRQVSKRGTVGFQNTGFVGDGFLAGGFPMVSLFMFLFGLMTSVASRATFGSRRLNVFWVPMMVFAMFIPADVTFSGAPPFYFWGWVIYSSAVFFLLNWMARRDPGIVAA